MFRHRSKPKVNDSPTAELEALIAGEIRHAGRLEGALGEAARMLAAEAPAECRAKAVRVTPKRHLIIRVPDYSARYLLETHLRCGLGQRLILAGKGEVVRVKVEVRV